MPAVFIWTPYAPFEKQWTMVLYSRKYSNFCIMKQLGLYCCKSLHDKTMNNNCFIVLYYLNKRMHKTQTKLFVLQIVLWGKNSIQPNREYSRKFGNLLVHTQKRGKILTEIHNPRKICFKFRP